MVKAMIPQIACQKVLNNTVIKVLRIKQKLKNGPYFTCQHRKKVDQSFIFSERFNWKEKAST